MIEFDKILWGFIFSAVGIILGWTLNQIGQWFKSREEDKKTLKVVLFNLLETYFLFINSDFDKIIKKVIDKVFEKIPLDQKSDEGKTIIHLVYKSLSETYLQPELKEEIKILQENYKNSIKTLSAVDPLTAYYLSGKTNNIFEHFNMAENYFDSVKEKFPNDVEEINFWVNKFKDSVKPDIMKDILDDLEDDIKNVALKINPLVWYNSKKALNRLKINANEKIELEINRLFEKFENQY